MPGFYTHTHMNGHPEIEYTKLGVAFEERKMRRWEYQEQVIEIGRLISVLVT